MLFPVKVRAALVGLVVAGGAAAALALGPAGLAVGQSSPPTVGQSSTPNQLKVAVNSPATLVARGVGVDVSVTVTCSGPLPSAWNVSIYLTEEVGTALATGSSFGTFGPTLGSINCTGRPQHAEVLVIANPGNKAFVAGTAEAQIGVSACEIDTGLPCANAPTPPTIKIST